MADINFGSGGSSGVVNTGQMTTAFVAQPKPGAFLGADIPVQSSGFQDAFSFASVEQLVNLPQQLWDAGEMKESLELLELAKKAGYSSWEAAMAGAANDPLKNERGYMDFLQAQADKVKALGLDTGLDGEGYKGPVTTNYTMVNESSTSEAGSDIDTVFQEEMGRMATEAEIRLYQRLLNQQQRANPELRSYYSDNADGPTNTVKDSQSGGFDARRFATEFVRSRPDYAETYAGTKFMDILDRFISEPNALDQMIGQ